MPGEFAGSASSSSRSASVPPVEAPTQTTISVVFAIAPIFGGGSTASAVSLPWTGRSFRRLARSLETLARAAPFTVWRICSACSARWSAAPILGLRMMSTAPASSACISVSEPVSVSDEHITTGIGCCDISLRRKVMPSICGISTSSVMTSGISSRSFLAAMNGSLATPMISISGSSDKRVESVCRTLAESSTIRTRILPPMLCLYPLEDCVGDLPDRQIEAADGFRMTDEQVTARYQAVA
ncbi:hypothetical protein D3C73_990020 [compost metagenome]